LLGVYTYCILKGEKNRNLKVTGINDRPVYSLDYKDISALVSNVPFKKIEPSMEDVISHHKVVEAARSLGIVLPIRFGVIYKNKAGTRKLLRDSYNEIKSKLDKSRGK